jgi:diadenosine tetraphosphate (Ap4A) HIT family hydrolase
VQLEHVQAAWLVPALPSGDPAVAGGNASVVVKTDAETAEEERQLDLDSVVEAVQASEEKMGQAAPTNTAEQHVPMTSSTSLHVHQHTAPNQTRYAKQEATESPQVQPSPIQKTTTLQLMRRNDVVYSSHSRRTAPTPPLSTKEQSPPPPSQPFSPAEHTLGFQAWG